MDLMLSLSDVIVSQKHTMENETNIFLGRPTILLYPFSTVWKLSCLTRFLDFIADNLKSLYYNQISNFIRINKL